LAPSSARIAERLTLAAGALALAASSFLPELAAHPFSASDGWTLYAPAHLHRADALTPWSLRPSLAILLLAAAALVLATGWTVRAVAGRRAAAGAAVLAVALLVLDAAHWSGGVVSGPQQVGVSAWLAVPVAGGLGSAAALVLGRGPAQRGT
jgi:hypothetical protein